jgi:hypothetical protein
VRVGVFAERRVVTHRQRLAAMLLLAILPSLAAAQTPAPRWWQRDVAGRVVGLGTAVSVSREMAVDRARELALADIARQREVTFRAERIDVTRESVAADSGTLERRGQLIVTANARAEVGPLSERVQTKRLSDRRWRAWVLLR